MVFYIVCYDLGWVPGISFHSLSWLIDAGRIGVYSCLRLPFVPVEIGSEQGLAHCHHSTFWVFVLSFFSFYQAWAWAFSVATVCIPTPHFAMSPKGDQVFALNQGKRILVAGGRKRSVVALGTSLSFFQRQHIAAQRARSQDRDTGRLPGAHGRGLTLTSLCVPTPSARVGIEDSSRAILALRPWVFEG